MGPRGEAAREREMECIDHEAKLRKTNKAGLRERDIYI